MIATPTKKNIELQLQHIASIAGEKYNELDHIGVLGGQAGVALFQFYCAWYFDEDQYAEKGVEIISNCIDKINDGYAFPTYCNGIAGFGWALQHLVDEGFIELDLDELLTPFDEYLINQMEFDFENNNYDLLHGGMGYGLYFQKRYNSQHTSEHSKKGYHKFLARLVDLLEQTAIEDGDGLKWESVLNIEEGNKGFNLSLSHGMSSILHLLFKIHKVSIEKEKVVRLTQGAIHYIKRHQKDEGHGISLFPGWLEPGLSLIHISEPTRPY